MPSCWGESVAEGPVVMVVSLNEQHAYVYRNGVLIGATTVSTGRPGRLTLPECHRPAEAADNRGRPR